MPRMHTKSRRQPYVVTVRGPGLQIEATLDGAGSFRRLVERIGEAVGAVGGAMAEEHLRTAFSDKPPPDYYTTLGVRPDATTREINEAYIKKIASTLPLDEVNRVIEVAILERDRRVASTS
jgi:predicted trehalose synthase